MTIKVDLSVQEFRRFFLFETFRRKKMWRSPAIFASILGGCACICFLMKHIEGAVMLGCVLLLVGLGMPALFLISTFSSITQQAKAAGLPKVVYTLHLSACANGIAVKNDQEQADYNWKDVHHVYRNKTATYLYMTPTRAFILPHSCIEEGDESGNALWQLIKKKLPETKQTVI